MGRSGSPMPRLMTSTPLFALLGDLPLHLGEEIGGQVVHPPGESHVRLLAISRSRASASPAGAASSSLSSQVNISSAGPVMNTRRPSLTLLAPPALRSDASTSIVRSPPSRCTVTGLAASPSRTAAAPTAVAPVPHAWVSPTPRSHTRMRTEPSASTRMNSTFTRLGNSGCRSMTAPTVGQVDLRWVVDHDDAVRIAHVDEGEAKGAPSASRTASITPSPAPSPPTKLGSMLPLWKRARPMSTRTVPSLQQARG